MEEADVQQNCSSYEQEQSAVLCTHLFSVLVKDCRTYETLLISLLSQEQSYYNHWCLWFQIRQICCWHFLVEKCGTVQQHISGRHLKTEVLVAVQTTQKGTRFIETIWALGLDGSSLAVWSTECMWMQHGSHWGCVQWHSLQECVWNVIWAGCFLRREIITPSSHAHTTHTHTAEFKFSFSTISPQRANSHFASS